MKIDIDLSEIFEDEDGSKVSPDFIERIEQIVSDKIISTLGNRINRFYNDDISKVITAKVDEILTSMIPEFLDLEYTPTGCYGDKNKPTTIRNKICKDIEKAMVWKDSQYQSEQSVYTKIVKATVEAKLKDFSKEFNKTIDDKFIADCMEYASDKLRKTLKT